MTYTRRQFCALALGALATLAIQTPAYTDKEQETMTMYKTRDHGTYMPGTWANF